MPRVLALRHALVCVLFGLAGCTRGCDVLGTPAEPCDDDGDCDAPETCYRGYCASPGYVSFARACQAAPGCREQGKCGALRVRSFLGADNSLECAAVDEADCRAAQRCATHGTCSLSDGWCVAASDEECAASQRCPTHEECSAEHGACVRRWPECPPFSPPPGAPNWYHPSTDAVVDLRTVGGPWQPGALDAGVIACEVRLAQAGRSRVRLGGRCQDGPRVRSAEPATFLLSGVRLAPGDELAVVVQAFDDRSSAATDSFVKAKYAGASPFAGGAGDEALVCHVVAREAALALVADALAQADSELAAVQAFRPRNFGTPPLAEARGAIAEAALWLGWADAEVRARLQRMVAIEQAWNGHLVAWLTELRKEATSPDGTARADKLSIQVTGRVCGAELAARRGDARPTEASTCGLELTVTNRGKKPQQFTTEYFPQMEWLAVIGGVAQRGDVEVVGGERSVELPARGSAAFVLTGRDRDLPPVASDAGDFSLLRGRITASEWITLRAEPSSAAGTKAAK
ncbi:hypothetical protein SAMN02745121_05863 [Nannocystis exedens]|uniref:Lipoprotein n=1 Tax=Nannocystis exedens TaxID=54 RepID=A0A1I2E1R1_9BACT|nr:hypothetical protein [Nannocystis exedens]PCC69218.1 hypothetical protein NAEX_02240 [Nannocystis exedens]SFE86639.1 hypothetical protein SAMN02745121_05863 [Nannocystis exedens]